MSDFKGTKYRVFAILQKCKMVNDLCKKTSYTEDKAITILGRDENSFVHWFNNSNKYTQKLCLRVWNDIENSLYDYHDLFLFCMYEYLMNGKINFASFSKKNINMVRELFTIAQFVIDKQTILEIHHQVKLKDISDYFKINGGDCIAYELTKNKIISPMFFIKIRPQIKVEVNEASTDFLAFERMINIITKAL